MKSPRLVKIHFEVSLIFALCCLTSIIISQHQEEQACRTSNGKIGYCINLKSQIKFCPKLHSWLQSGNVSDWEKIRLAFCAKNITQDQSRVCCPQDLYEETPSSRNDPLSSEPDYSKHPNFKLLPHDLKCGYGGTGMRIIGGEIAQPGDFPWMARIALSKGNRQGQPSFGCSGTIINQRYILTAAHCLHPVLSGTHNLSVIRLAETDEKVNPESITIESGYVLATSPYLDYSHEDFIVHPNYTESDGKQHDIALIRLNREINITSFTQPVCLPFVNEYYVENSLSDDKILRKNVTVCGWGKTSSSAQEGSSVLQYVKVLIQSNILCRIIYQYSHNISDTQICAGGRKGQSSCAGDSGGPLTKLASPDNPHTKSIRHFQIGIVSFGKAECAGADEPVVYTRIRSYLTWILDNIRE